MKTVSLLLFLSLSFSWARGQDSTSMTNGLKAIDSLTGRIEKNSRLVQTEFFAGPNAISACTGGTFKGIAYRNAKSNTVDKMLLINDTTSERTVCYCLQNRIAKIVVNNATYYHMGDRYVNEYGLPEISPDLFRQFVFDEEILKMAIMIAR